MFNDLLALLEKRSLVLTLSALPEKRIRVTVTPRPKSDEDKKVVIVPLVVEGTAAELDEGFAKAITDYSAASRSLEDSLAEVKATMDAEVKAAKDDAAKKVAEAKKNGKTSTTTTVKPAAKAEAAKPEPKKEPEPSPLMNLFEVPGVTDTAAPEKAKEATAPAVEATTESVTEAVSDDNESQEDDDGADDEVAAAFSTEYC